MTRKISPAILLGLIGICPGADDGKLRFNQDIRPILSDNCFACHGFDAKKRKADLRLDTPEGAYAVIDGAQAIKPGDLAKSEVWARIISEDEEEVMPPPDSHKKLTAEQKAIIKRWIEQGAEYQKHWAFETPVKPEVPVIGVQSSVFSGSAGTAPNTEHRTRNTGPIDAFIAERLKREGLTPSPEADRKTLIRRVALDLTGLPPTIPEVDAFLADRSPGAYERAVDRLLGSPRYGEHMARYWLDLARYGDTHGLHLDNERSMWPYRDWVVKAFNDNLRFDDFTRWQLAGDLLPNATREQQIASGFNRCNVTTSEGGSINEEFVFRYAVDRTASAVEVWMGLTAGCAVCHDHKFDPISQKEFYSLYAFFNSAADPAMDGNKIDTPPIVKLTTPEQQKRIEEFSAQAAAVKQSIKAALDEFAYVDPATLNPPPEMLRRETVWVDDSLPPKAKPEGDGKVFDFTEKSGDPAPFSGERSLRRRVDSGVGQDYFTGAEPFEIRPGVKFFAHVFLDPHNPPTAIMVQFHTPAGWQNRANWGDESAIPMGDRATRTKMQVGALPKRGEWVRVEVNPATVGLKAGTKVDGVAFTQSGGTVHWDKAGWLYETNPATDPLHSLSVWDKANQGKIVKEAPKEIQDIVRSVKPAARTEDQWRKVREYYLEFVSRAPEEALAPLRKKRDELKAQQEQFEKDVPFTFVMADLPQPREAFVMVRGQYDKPGEKVARGTPAAFPPLPKRDSYTRLDLAEWLVSPEHPLTARVTVNRFWQQFFGTGLVKTSGDFGSQGEPPSHPELLDWLAVTFRESGWDVKAFVKMLVTSAAYRQSTKVTPALLAKDPENRLYARGPRFRLDAEVLRDNALFVSGLLNPKIGGKGVRPYQPPNIWEPVGFGNSNTRYYTQDHGDALYRRSLYTFLKRTAPPPFMATFDAPNREQVCTRRERSNTPLQALQLMNDIQHFEAARNFAQRMMLEGGATPAERIAWAWRTVTSRKPADGELAIVEQALQKHLEKYRANPAAAKEAISYGESKRDENLDPAELAAYSLVANLVLNLDETVTKN